MSNDINDQDDQTIVTMPGLGTDVETGIVPSMERLACVRAALAERLRSAFSRP